MTSPVAPMAWALCAPVPLVCPHFESIVDTFTRRSAVKRPSQIECALLSSVQEAVKSGTTLPGPSEQVEWRFNSMSLLLLRTR